MTVAAGSRVLGISLPMRELGWRAALPVLVLLVAQVGLFVWMAPRGFEFTDEAYYFLNYLYWRDLVGTVSFFGAYFELPFRMLGQSVAAIRVFGLLLLLASSAFYSREALRFFSRRDGAGNDAPLAFVLAGMAASLFYFGYLSTLRAPSYNLLALCSMLVATGLLLRLLEPSGQLGNPRLAMFCYGMALGACGLAKAPSGAMMVACHALFFAVANRDWRLPHLLEFVALSLAGVALNFAVLQWVHPQWLTVLREGVAMVSATDRRSLLGLVGWDGNALQPVLLPLALGAVVMFVQLVRWMVPTRRIALAVLVVALISGGIMGLLWEGQTSRWLPLLGLVVLMLWSIDGLTRKPFRLLGRDAADFGLMALLFALPVAFSYGTNMHVLEHSQKAAVFGITGISLMLHRLFRHGFLPPLAIVACLILLCVPPLVIQLRAALDVHYTYRQLSALGEQTMPVSIGAANDTLLVDPTTRETLQSVIGVARAAGLVPGQMVLDLTGDGPGLVFALGAKPLGAAWLAGGYPGSHATAARLVAQFSPQQLQSAWLLSSDNNPRAIGGWQQLLSSRLGTGSHELVATVPIRAPYNWGKNSPEIISIQLWRPRLVAGSGAGQ